MNIHITCSTDVNYMQHCMAMLCSVLENNQKHDITIHLLHHLLPQSCQEALVEMCNRYDQEIMFYDVDVSKIGSVHITHPDLSIATYYRLLLPSLLDESIDRILYLDCDVIVLKDISELFQVNLDGFGVAAVKDSCPYSNSHRMFIGLGLDSNYFCAGVLLINMKYWREHNSSEVMFDFLDKHSEELYFEDQDVLNYAFRNHWFQLSNKYGKSPMAIAIMDGNQKCYDHTDYLFDASIIHYATHVKPWLDIRIPNDQYYWKYVKLSRFPNPQQTKASAVNRKRIQKSKIRYYINWYVRPWIPDLIELLIKDIFNLLALIIHLFRPNSFKYYHLKRFLSKYNK